MDTWRKVINLFPFLRPKLSCIRIEGGLGSQIFGIAKYNYVKQINQNEVGLDFSYFTSPRKSRNHPGLSFWTWALDSYGYSLQDLIQTTQKAGPNKELRIFSEVSDSEVWSWLKTNQQSFPIQLEMRNETLDKLNIAGDFNAIHIRRGDYSKISALILEHEQYLSLISKITGLLEPTTLIFSDDYIDEITRERYVALLGEQTHFLSSEHLSDRTSHDLMRTAANLVTANSTFSISAAMLNANAKRIFSPIKFSSQDASSNSFLTLGDWYLHL